MKKSHKIGDEIKFVVRKNVRTGIVAAFLPSGYLVDLNNGWRVLVYFGEVLF